MESRQLIVQLKSGHSENAELRYTGALTRLDGGATVDQRELWFEYPKGIKLSSNTDGNQFLLAVLMDAMREKRHIKIKGKVSEVLVRNLREYQRYWSMMRPGTYSPVEIEAEGYSDETRSSPQAVLAFSGGLDSVFSAWSNNEDGRTDIAMAAMIHGFDIPLSSADAYRRLSGRWTANLGKKGLPLHVARTNFRDVVESPWEDVFGTALAAALTPFKAIAGYAVIGSSAPYDALIHPYGSSPITDHLLSTGDFGIIHDGAAFKRLDKARAIARWPEAMDHLQVCWEGEARDRNCDSCEKCIRTKVHFAIQGLPIPGSFGEVRNIHREIRTVRINTIGALTGWTQMKDYAANHHLAHWRFSIGIIMLKNRLRHTLQKPRRFLRVVRRRLLSPVKRVIS